MKVTVKVSPVRAQYIAALVEFWEIFDSDDSKDMETPYAIQLLPKLIEHLSIELNLLPNFFDGLFSLAAARGWNASDCAYLLRLKDDNAPTREECMAIIEAYYAEVAALAAPLPEKAGGIGFRPPRPNVGKT